MPSKVTKVTTQSYQGHYWISKIAKKNGPKQHNKLFFCPKGKKSLGLGRRPPQELEVGPRSRAVPFSLLEKQKQDKDSSGVQFVQRVREDS